MRVGQVLENGRVDTKRLGKHRGAVFKLAVEPGSPYILYSCGEDGFVQHVWSKILIIVANNLNSWLLDYKYILLF